MPETKRTSPLFWIALLGLGAAAYVATTPEEPTKARKVQRTAAKKTQVEGGFLEEDYKAKFAKVSDPVKNAFVPQVVSSKGGLAGPNALPGGSWVFTGTAELNGSRTALVENTSTGEGRFLSVGDAWERYTVASIRDTSLVLRSPDGSTRTVSVESEVGGLADGQPPLVLSSPADAGSLRGPIGNVDVRPLSANTAPNANGERNAN
jgi:hypothetical protein